MMKIDHLALWCNDIEKMREFYMKYFNCTSNKKYYNPKKQFSSYFLSFEEGDCRIELMNRKDIDDEPTKRGFMKGIAHFDIEVGDKKKVDSLYKELEQDGYTIASQPRVTGDGYYELAVLDPEGNYVEISAEK
jgi:lactoylglutathione lyase